MPDPQIHRHDRGIGWKHVVSTQTRTWDWGELRTTFQNFFVHLTLDKGNRKCVVFIQFAMNFAVFLYSGL